MSGEKERGGGGGVVGAVVFSATVQEAFIDRGRKRFLTLSATTNSKNPQHWLFSCRADFSKIVDK